MLHTCYDVQRSSTCIRTNTCHLKGALTYIPVTVCLSSDHRAGKAREKKIPRAHAHVQSMREGRPHANQNVHDACSRPKCSFYDDLMCAHCRFCAVIIALGFVFFFLLCRLLHVFIAGVFLVRALGPEVRTSLQVCAFTQNVVALRECTCVTVRTRLLRA